MARSVEEIQQQIIDQKNSYSELSGLDSDSNTADWRLWTFIAAVVHNTLERLFDQFLKLVNDTIATLKPHRSTWYRDKVLAFQYGHSLADGGEADYYDNSSRTDAEVEAAKIVKYCAIKDDKIERELKIKVAGAGGVQLDESQESALDAYIAEVADAGVYWELINRPADKLKITIKVIYDPQVLDSDGTRLTGGSGEPAADAANEYLQELGFDGMFVLASLVDKLQAVEGIVVPTIMDAQYENSEGDFVPLGVRVIPFSGRFTFMDGETNNLTINYEADDV